MAKLKSPPGLPMIGKGPKKAALTNVIEPSLKVIIPKLVAGRAWVNARVLERTAETHMGFLGLIARKHLAYIGEAGAAKTMLVDLVRKVITGFVHFRLQVARDTPTKAIMSDMHLPTFVNEGRVIHKVDLYLPVAGIGHLSEGFTLNTTTMMSMLGLLTDDEIRVGEETIRNDELTMMIDSNAEPETENVGNNDKDGQAQVAFVRRFSLKCRVNDELTRESEVQLYYSQVRGRVMKEDPPPEAQVSREEILFLRKEIADRIGHDSEVYKAAQADIDAGGKGDFSGLKYMPLEFVHLLIDFRKELKLAGNKIDFRRMRWAIETMMGNAFLHERDVLSVQDVADTYKFWAPNKLEDLVKAHEVARDFVTSSEARLTDIETSLGSEFAGIMNKDRKWADPKLAVDAFTELTARHTDSITEINMLGKKHPNELSRIMQVKGNLQDAIRRMQVKVKEFKPKDTTK